ncbi:hypothetical protein WJX72_001879 [[Myrmecia] bisecta]|uniref:Uncharacterized protein n=1 Tax=[Myrmecia] bisecta TaxID=41462 RepID=A0AAW1P5K1_9CHLO
MDIEAVPEQPPPPVVVQYAVVSDLLTEPFWWKDIRGIPEIRQRGLKELIQANTPGGQVWLELHGSYEEVADGVTVQDVVGRLQADEPLRIRVKIVPIGRDQFGLVGQTEQHKPMD